jgi:hypothetical protein
MVIGAVQQVIRTIFVRHNSENSAHKPSLFPIGILSMVQEIIDVRLPPAFLGGASRRAQWRAEREERNNGLIVPLDPAYPALGGMGHWPANSVAWNAVFRIFTPAAESYVLWPWMNSSTFDRDVAPQGR